MVALWWFPCRGRQLGGGSLLFSFSHSLADFLGENAFFSILLLLFEILLGPITRQWELPAIFILWSICLGVIDLGNLVLPNIVLGESAAAEAGIAWQAFCGKGVAADSC